MTVSSLVALCFSCVLRTGCGGVSLQFLSSRFSRMRDISVLVGAMSNLRYLDWSNNAISLLPESVGALGSVDCVDLKYNVRDAEGWGVQYCTVDLEWCSGPHHACFKPAPAVNAVVGSAAALVWLDAVLYVAAIGAAAANDRTLGEPALVGCQ